MSRYSLTHLSDSTLLRELPSFTARERSDTADVLARIAEVDARKLYAEVGYSSMFAYCVHELRFSESAALNRIRAARAALEFPAIFVAVENGSLDLAAVLLLKPHLTPESADQLLAAAENKTRAEVEHMLAQRLTTPALQECLAPVDQDELPADQLLPGGVDSTQVVANTESDVPPCAELGPLSTVPASLPYPRLKPIAPGFYSLQVPIDQKTHDRLRQAQALLSHRVPSGDLSQVLDRALVALIGQLEKRKCGATTRPRQAQESPNPRHIPAHVRRAVWERDRGQCTYVSPDGRHCCERRFIEFDHEVEVARGGTNSVGNIRLRCRTHNQHGAEHTFGAEFMRRKRAEAVATREQAKPAPRGEGIAPVASQAEADLDVVPWLRALGVRADQARDVARRCVHEPDDTLERRVRRALSFVGPQVRQSASPSLSA